MTASPVPYLTPRELDEVRRAQSTGRPVVAFVHGLWLLSDSWDLWRKRFEARGYATIAPGWPGDPASVEQGRVAERPASSTSLAAVTDHYANILQMFSCKPIVIGHSFGGLVAQQLAARGLSACTVAISPAPSRGVWSVAPSALRATWPVLRNPVNRRRTVALSFEQFSRSFANVLDADEARHLYETYAVAGFGRPVFEAAFANLRSGTAAQVDTTNPERGPMKIVAGEQDRVVPWSSARRTFLRQLRNPGHTEFFEMPERGHSMVIDSRWEDVADAALRFIHRTYTSRRETCDRLASCAV